jgi:FtsZ-binding cell division protein ZapB
MAVDSNFERLELEVNRLVEVLGKLRQENAELKTRAESLAVENEQLKSETARLQQIEAHYQEANESRETIKGRIENILAKLDAVEL